VYEAHVHIPPIAIPYITSISNQLPITERVKAKYPNERVGLASPTENQQVASRRGTFEHLAGCLVFLTVLPVCLEDITDGLR